MQSGIEGFIYAAESEQGPASRASSGLRIGNPDRRPPFLVVDHRVDSVIVARWPGRLWRVRVVDEVTESDEIATGIGRLVQPPRYTRAIAVDVIEELPVSILFGPHGADVCAIITAAAGLELTQAHALFDARHPDAAAGQSRAWNRWFAAYTDGAQYSDENLEATQEMPSVGNGSPINDGFSVIHSVASRRAETICGNSSFVVDDEGNSSLTSPWSGAVDALLCAAMAFGAPEWVIESDLPALTVAWQTVFGPGRPRSL